MPQGFILAPEFYQAYTVGSDRTFLAQQLEAIAADPRYCWVSIVDCGAATATATTGAGAINLALAEKALVASPKGHSLFYFPYLKNGLGTLVPPSPMVAGVALRRYLQQGFRQPPAGMDYPVYGATDTSFPVTGDVNGQLNAQNVNCVRRLPNGGGIVVYGARTMSTNALYRYMTVRVIFNVLNRTLEAAYQRIPFQSVDGQGVLFGLMKATATGILETMRQGGALFGATPEDAYRVVCDLTNNGANDLENGLVRVTVLAKPSPMVEFVSVEVTRMPLGAILSEVVSSGDTGNIRNLAV
jgi:phage tail sheath protein FI